MVESKFSSHQSAGAGKPRSSIHTHYWHEREEEDIITLERGMSEGGLFKALTEGFTPLSSFSPVMSVIKDLARGAVLGEKLIEDVMERALGDPENGHRANEMKAGKILFACLGPGSSTAQSYACNNVHTGGEFVTDIYNIMKRHIQGLEPLFPDARPVVVTFDTPRENMNSQAPHRHTYDGLESSYVPNADVSLHSLEGVKITSVTFAKMGPAGKWTFEGQPALSPEEALAEISDRYKPGTTAPQADQASHFSAEDVKYLARNHLALRHVRGNDRLAEHYAGPKEGDAHCIGAMHLLLTEEEKRESRMPGTYLDVVEKYADRIAPRLDEKLERIISQSKVTFDDRIQPENYFLLMRGMDGADNPYDLHAYPMGKAGTQTIHDSQISAVVACNPNYGEKGIAEDIRNMIRADNVNGILNKLYPAAQEIMDGKVPADRLEGSMQSFAKNLDTLASVDPESAYSYAAALLISPQAHMLHDTAERVAVGSLTALSRSDPDNARIRANIAIELGPRSELQTRLANAVGHLSDEGQKTAASPPVSKFAGSGAPEEPGKRDWASLSSPERFLASAKAQVDSFLEGRLPDGGITKAIKNLGDTLETYTGTAPKAVAGFCAEMLLNPDLDRFSEVAGKAYGGAMNALRSVDAKSAIATAKEHIDNYGGIAAVATVATAVIATAASAKSAPVSLVRNVAKRGVGM